MDFLAGLVGLLFALLIVIQGLQLVFVRSKKLPPGPTPMPIIGNLHLLGKKPHQSMAKLAKIHGPIMHLRLGFTDTVVVSSSALAKEVLQKQGLAFSSRAIPNALHAHDYFKYSVLCLPAGARWQSLRKIWNTIILSGNQQLRSQKVQELIAYCGKSGEMGEAVDIGRAAFRTSLNMLSETVFSKDLADPFLDSAKELKEIMWNIMVEVGKPNLVDFFPVLDKIDPQGIRSRLTNYMGKLIEILKVMVDERLERGTPFEDTEMSDVLDLLLAISKESPQKIDRTHIERLCLDIFIAGTETNSSVVEWAMAEALKNPEIMKKAKLELEEVVGKGKIINEADLPRLPYLRNMVKETLRLHPSVPVIVRKAEQGAQVCGYTVPKDAQMLVNVWAIGRDADNWANPLEFKPERFLESEVDFHGRDFELIPFGGGRRMCPGLPLAMRTVPVMVGSLLNSFDWKLEGTELDMEEKFGITLQKANPLRAIPVPLCI